MGEVGEVGEGRERTEEFCKEGQYGARWRLRGLFRGKSGGRHGTECTTERLRHYKDEGRYLGGYGRLGYAVGREVSARSARS